MDPSKCPEEVQDAVRLLKYGVNNACLMVIVIDDVHYLAVRVNGENVIFAHLFAKDADDDSSLDDDDSITPLFASASVH